MGLFYTPQVYSSFTTSIHIHSDTEATTLSLHILFAQGASIPTSTSRDKLTYTSEYFILDMLLVGSNLCVCVCVCVFWFELRD